MREPGTYNSNSIIMSYIQGTGNMFNLPDFLPSLRLNIYFNLINKIIEKIPVRVENPEVNEILIKNQIDLQKLSEYLRDSILSFAKNKIDVIGLSFGLFEDVEEDWIAPKIQIEIFSDNLDKILDIWIQILKKKPPELEKALIEVHPIVPKDSNGR